jgi:MerR family transcriptional regulator/heat shock protein HspR
VDIDLPSPTPPVPDRAAGALEPRRGMYGISVAAELVDMEPQSLRLYESRGLVRPQRTSGGTRRYSEVDLGRLRRIGELLGMGLNLAGVALVLDLESQNAALRAELDQVRTEG